MKTQFLLLSVLSGLVVFTNPSPVGSQPAPFPDPPAIPEKTGPGEGIYILIDKSDYELTVYDNQGWYATYPVVFGNNSLSDKKMQGDKNTPEGSFKIIAKRIHDKWNRFLTIDYPNQESWQKFTERRQKGEIPVSAKIGGGIGIHGTWPHEDFQIDRFKNWTLGCISMKNADVEELYSYVPSGTKVIIRK